MRNCHYIMTSHNQYKTKLTGCGKKMENTSLIPYSEEEIERKTEEIERNFEK